MTVFKWDPGNVNFLKNEIDTLFDAVMGVVPRKTSSHPYTMCPVADVIQTGDAVVFELEIPGAGKEALEVKTEAGMLSIHAEKHPVQHSDTDNNKFHVAERSWGTYERSFAIPDFLELDKAVADYTNGVLTVSIPRREETAKREIKIPVK